MLFNFLTKRKKFNPDKAEYILDGVPFFSQRVDEKNYSQEGFENLAQAKEWTDKICGLACLKMVLGARYPLRRFPLKELLTGGLAIGAYRDDIGWIHQGLVNIGASYGIKGGRESIYGDIEKIGEYIAKHKIVIASVTAGFEHGKVYRNADGSEYTPPRGGHLVVIFGVEFNPGNKTIKRFLIHHPSSEESYEKQYWWVDAEIFRNSFSKKGNIIYFQLL